MAKKKLTPQQEQERRETMDKYLKDTFLEAFWELDDEEKNTLLQSEKGKSLFPNGLVS